MKEIEVISCWNCPFANNDNEFGIDYCNLGRFPAKRWEQLPEDATHEDCPLKQYDVKVKLKK